MAGRSQALTLVAGLALAAAVACDSPPPEVRLEGVVYTHGACMALEAKGRNHELVGGDRTVLVPGRYVVIRGVLPEEWNTACDSAGYPLEVHEIECASTATTYGPKKGRATLPPPPPECARK